MRQLYFLSFINKNKTFRDSNTISKSKCNIVMSEKINLKFFFEKTQVLWLVPSQYFERVLTNVFHICGPQ